MKKIITLLWAVCGLMSMSMAQTVNEVEMADGMRASGKIYVVVAVIVLIFLGLLAYLFNLDRRIRKIENEK